ncbi:MAG: aminotransferase class IV [Bacteroidetes bacterium]|nr:aminotransferase class IV [Bacteroidota bacterium]MBL7105405.1 aminotransferase class IV [Bacteroidales bacterium]
MCLLFETIKVINKNLQNIEYHNSRLNRSRKELFGADDFIYLENIIKIPSSLSDDVYKCRVIYDKKIEKIEFEPYKPRIIHSLKLVECNDIEYGFKYHDRSMINELFEKRGDCDDILIIRNGWVTDTSFSNIILFNGKQWVTPSHPLLFGTKRQKLLDEGKIISKKIKSEDISKYQGARLINSMLDPEDGFLLTFF